MKRYGFGVDIGGTACKIGLFEENGILVEKWEIKTNTANNGDQILADIALEIQNKIQEKSIAQENILGIGVGVPGPVEATGVVNGCVNLGWKKKAVATEIKAYIDVPIAVGNDANVAALGELLYGCGKGKNSLVMVTLGTGVGGGIVDRKKILCGVNGAAGEIGHLIVNENESEPCNCGRYGCLEQYVSATGIQKLAKRKLAVNESSTTLTMETITAKTVIEAAKAGDSLAEEIVNQIATILGKALANIAVIVNPEIFAVGGGVSNAGIYFMEKVEKAYQNYVFYACRETPVVVAELGNDAGIYGCMGMLREESGI